MPINQRNLAEFSMVTSLSHLQSLGAGKWESPSSDRGCRFRFKCDERVSELVLFGRDDKQKPFIAFPQALKHILLKQDVKVFLNANSIVIWMLAIKREIEISFPFDKLIFKTYQRELNLGKLEQKKSINLCIYEKRRGSDFKLVSNNAHPVYVNLEER